jgi:hypothetical protein
MKQDRVAKMYEGLNSKEQALLAFNYLTENNELEIKRIGDAVPTHKYVCKDAEFMSWFDKIFNFAAYWSTEHWKAYAYLMETRFNIQVALNKKNHDEVKRLLDVFGKMEARLLAVDAAMLAVCEDHDIDADGFRRMAGCDTFSNDGLEPDADYLAELLTNFGRLLATER